MKSAVVVLVALLAFATNLAAQCTDGSKAVGDPPVCANALAASTRRDPPLDERTWLVLPFDNITRDQALDVIRDAGVTLLYLEMSRWTDIRVIDDTRVADLTRDLPAGGRIGQEAGFEFARRAGAGKLVMGTVLKEGVRTVVAAGVFDVRARQRLRNVRDGTTGTDSLSPMFGRLANSIVALPPLAGTLRGAVGSASIEALREYAAGMQQVARHRWDSAGTHFRRSVALDSNFALAHLRLSQALYRGGPSEAQRKSLATAVRLADQLPQRERLVIGLVDATPGALCDLGSRLLRLDSADVEGWMAIGRCHASSNRILDEGGRLRFEGSRNTARRAFERALELQPGEVEAFGGLVAAAFSLGRQGCSVTVSGSCPLDSLYTGVSVIESDTIVTHVERWRAVRFDPPRRQRTFAAARLALAARARDLAASWTAANPGVWFGHIHHAITRLRTGDLDGADRALAATDAGLPRENANRNYYYAYRIEVELRRELPHRASAVADSLLRDGADPFSGQVPSAEFATAMSRFTRDVAVADSTPDSRALRSAFLGAFAGVVPPDFEQTVRRYADARAAAAGPGRAAWVAKQTLELGSVLGFHVLRSGPALDTASAFSLIRYQAFLARGDTAGARRALAAYDDRARSRADDYFDGGEMFSAESHLELGDSATAWERIRPLGDRWAAFVFVDSQLWSLEGTGLAHAARVIGRAWLLYADLAMALGHREEARRGYRFVVGLWEKGEAPVQPLVQRAKEALVKLGS